VKEIHYRIDEGQDQIYKHPIIISEEGPHTFMYWAIDNAGNEEEHHTVWLKIDKHDPVVSITRPREGYLYLFDSETRRSLLGLTIVIGDITVESQATDAMSGIDRVEFYLDGMLQHTVTGEQSGYGWRCTRSMLFIHAISVRAIDKAGNSEESIIYIFAINL